MKSENVFIIVPTYNEAAVIRETLQPLIDGGYSVVVVDDGSTDETYAKIKQMPVHILRHIINLGQGAALQTGMEYALRRGADIIVHFDADGQHNPHNIEHLLQPILEKRVEVALGSRFLNKEHAREVPFAKRSLLRMATLFTIIVSNISLTDTHNGFRAFSRKAAEQIKITEDRMAHASEILHQIAKKKLPYTEVPILVFYTEYSKNKGQSISNSINILIDFLLGRFLR